MNIIVRRSAPGQVEPSANPSTRFAAPVKEYPLEVALAAAPRPKGDVNALVRLAEVDMAAVDALILDRMQSDVPIIPKLAEHLVSAGGKRLRPLLTVAAARASGAGDDIASRGYRLDYAGGVDKGHFFLRNGGFFAEPVKLGDQFKRKPTRRKPKLDLDALEGNS